MKNNRFTTAQLTLLGLMAAILLLMAYTPLGYLNIGPLAISFNVIPVAISAVVLGPVGGAVAGAIFGLQTSSTAPMPHPFQHPAQRRCPNSPCKQAQTQPLQSSSAALTTHNLSSNDIFSRWKHQPRKGMLSGSASAGGELILGRRESALFFKSPLSERQQAASSDF